MTNSFLNKENKKKFYLFCSYYLIFLSAFYINENSTGGAYQDYLGYKNLIELFLKDFKETFLTFDQYGERHSPLTIILLSLLYKLHLSDTFIRFIFFNFSIVSIIFFYKCLKIKFKSIPSNYLFAVSLIFFLSPVFRSLSVWPDSRIIGFHFFIISIFFYLKYFDQNKKIVFCYLNVIFLAISSYFSINFCLFGIFFFYKFYSDLINNKKLLNYLLINLTLAFPAFYYLFILDVFFISPGLTPGNENQFFGLNNNFNFSNKILIIGSIFFFYLLPFVFYFKDKFYLKELNRKELLLILIFVSLNILLFNYKIVFTGGGIFFKVSNYIFQNNIIFYLISFYSLIIIYLFLFKKNKIDNLILVLIILISNPQLSIYHKYYDPLLIFLFFTIFNLNFKKNYFSLKNIAILNIFYLSFWVLNFLK